MAPLTPDHSDSVPIELGERVVNRALLIGAIAAPAIIFFVVLQAILIDSLDTRTIVITLYSFSFTALWLFGRNLHYKFAGTTFIGLLMVMTFMVQIWSGLYTSQAPLQLVILIMGGLIFGRRGVYICFVLNLLLFFIAGSLILSGTITQGVGGHFDPTSPIVWFRSAAIMILFGGMSAWAVVFTVSRMQGETIILQETIARERAQLKALELAEKEKQDALQAMAEAKRIEVLGRLASGVAHDFNNSLTVIMTSAEMAGRDPDLSPRVRKFLDSIKRSSIQAGDMTKSLLALGRKDPSRLTLVSMEEVMKNIEESISRLLPEDIKFSIDESTSAKIYIDRTQLDRAILNLLLNAKDAITSQGEISIGCRQVNLMGELRGIKEGPYVQFWVKDNGHGIKPEVLEHIFEPFYTTKPSGKGTGMGMALIHSFAMEAAGKIEIDSTVGSGTKVYLYLPESTDEQVKLEHKSKSTNVALPKNEYRILVVEDNPEVLATTSDTLTQAGFIIMQAIDGDAALEIINRDPIPFDIMCIDGVIPGASTAEVIRQLQAKNSHIKIVVCSGYIEEELLLRGVRTGDLAYVRKPYLIDELLDCINTQLALTED